MSLLLDFRFLNLKILNFMTPLLNLFVFVICYWIVHRIWQQTDKITSCLHLSIDLINLSKILSLNNVLIIHIQIHSFFSFDPRNTIRLPLIYIPIFSLAIPHYTFSHFLRHNYSIMNLPNASVIAFSTTLTECPRCSCGNIK